MTLNEQDSSDSDELTAEEVAQFVALPRTQPIGITREDELAAWLRGERLIAGRGHKRRNAILAAAAAVLVFMSGTFAGYLVARAEAQHVGTDASSATFAVREPAAAAVVGPAAKERGTIWF